MAKYTTTDIILIVIGAVMAILVIIMIIREAERQMYIFGLRPSESTATEIAGLVTVSNGLPGSVDLVYKNLTHEVFYYIFIKDKTVCVRAEIPGAMNTTDCSSTAFSLVEQWIKGSGFEVKIEKDVGTEVELE
jgi:hypothetical protein